ncbi:MAG: hypothetical protein GY928_00065 [Colwellia sp.]|nr:hypothetical protein [Colwellia sp.]
MNLMIDDVPHSHSKFKAVFNLHRCKHCQTLNTLDSMSDDQNICANCMDRLITSHSNLTDPIDSTTFDINQASDPQTNSIIINSSITVVVPATEDTNNDDPMEIMDFTALPNVAVGTDDRTESPNLIDELFSNVESFLD